MKIESIILFAGYEDRPGAIPMDLPGGVTIFLRGEVCGEDFSEALNIAEPQPGETVLNTIPVRPPVS